MTFEERFNWIFRHRGTTANALSEGAGLSRAYIRMLIATERKGAMKRPGAAALQALAKAADVSVRWLSSGQGDPGRYEGDPASPAPPPVSDTLVSLDVIDDRINGAFDPSRHKPSDAIPVREALRTGGATLLKHDQDPLTYVRRLLDTAAAYRERGEKVTGAELPALALGHLSHRLSVQEGQVSALEAALAEARAWILANGLELPKNDPNAPTPAPAPPRQGPSLAAAGASAPVDPLRHPKPSKPRR